MHLTKSAAPSQVRYTAQFTRSMAPVLQHIVCHEVTANGKVYTWKMLLPTRDHVYHLVEGGKSCSNDTRPALRVEHLALDQ